MQFPAYQKKQTYGKISAVCFFRALLVVLHVARNVTYRYKCNDNIIRNDNAVFFFDRHQHFHNVQRIRAEIIYDIGIFINRINIHSQLFCKNYSLVAQRAIDAIISSLNLCRRKDPRIAGPLLYIYLIGTTPSEQITCVAGILTFQV